MSIALSWRRAWARVAATTHAETSRAGAYAPIDQRTLADIGIGPGPVFCVAERVGRDRLRPPAMYPSRNTVAPWWTSSRHSSAR